MLAWTAPGSSHARLRGVAARGQAKVSLTPEPETGSLYVLVAMRPFTKSAVSVRAAKRVRCAGHHPGKNMTASMTPPSQSEVLSEQALIAKIAADAAVQQAKIASRSALVAGVLALLGGAITAGLAYRSSVSAQASSDSAQASSESAKASKEAASKNFRLVQCRQTPSGEDSTEHRTIRGAAHPEFVPFTPAPSIPIGGPCTLIVTLTGLVQGMGGHNTPYTDFMIYDAEGHELSKSRWSYVRPPGQPVPDGTEDRRWINATFTVRRDHSEDKDFEIQLGLTSAYGSFHVSVAYLQLSVIQIPDATENTN